MKTFTTFRPTAFLVLALVASGFVRSAEACAVCFGAPGDQINEAISMAILGMLILLVGVLSSFVAFFFYLRHRAANLPAHLADLNELDEPISSS